MPPQHEEVASYHSRSVEPPERLEPVGVDAELLRQRAAEEETPILQHVAFEILVAVHRQSSQASMRCRFVFNSSRYPIGPLLGHSHNPPKRQVHPFLDWS